MSDVHCLLNLSWVLLCAGLVLLMQAGHALKSSSGMLGASPLAELCRQLEALGRAATLDRVPEVLSKLEASYPTVCASLEEEVGKGD